MTAFLVHPRSCWRKLAVRHSVGFAQLLVGILLGSIVLLEILFPTAYVFGHLYIAPLLLASFTLGKTATSIVTRVAILCTLSDLIVPNISALRVMDFEALPIYTFTNRINVAVVLFLTNWLIQSNLKKMEKIDRQKEEIAYHKAELLSQLKLAQMREDFVHTLTHDLKTPILGAIETIKSFQLEHFGLVSSIQSQVLNEMSKSQKRSLQLVQMLLDVYRNDAEGTVLQCQSIDLKAIATEAIDAVKILGLERELTLNLTCHESIVGVASPLENIQLKITADPLQLSRVFSNLLSNAIYHSPRGGQIDVTIYNSDCRYIVQVVDRGKGIDPEDLPFLFNRFYQAHQQGQGSGLGLYLSRQIVEAHGGKIWAENELPQGTKFCFSLPIGT
jgi:two-component system, NarL family, sensor kinase